MKLALNVNLKLSDQSQRYSILGLALWTSFLITQTAYALEFCLYLADQENCYILVTAQLLKMLILSDCI